MTIPMPPPNPAFPNVPMTPGVPAVRRDGPAPGGEKQLLETDKTKASLASTKTGSGWGVYAKGGSLAIEPDSIKGFEYGVDYRVADYPLAPGAFESYDKVATPYDARVVMTKGGTLSERTSFLKTLQSIQGDLKLYNVVTPEKTYLGVNIVHVSMVRSAESGAAMMTVEVQLREIRETATQTFTTTGDPAPPPAVASTKQNPRPPSTNPGTTKAPASARRISNGPAQPKKIQPMSAAEQKRIQQVWATGPHPREVIFLDAPRNDVNIGRGGM